MSPDDVEMTEADGTPSTGMGNIDAADAASPGDLRGQAVRGLMQAAAWPTQLRPSSFGKGTSKGGGGASDAALLSLPLEELKAMAFSLGIDSPPGHKGHKRTWAEAISAAQQEEEQVRPLIHEHS